MPSKKQYNLVQNDENDTRIPLHSEEAFHRGIIFHAKLIGSMEVPRPTSRMEIVAAMRRIRYEFKAKGIKKKKVTLEVSVDGLKVTLRKKKKKQHWHDESKLAIMHHPIYRIFYVSHDSHDLKIFSYIARDGSNNSFRCNVFKSSKKSQAMRVVRTVGQAFEVCHKLSLNNPPGSINCSEDQQQQNCNNDKDTDEGSERQRRDSHDDYDEEFASLRHQPSPLSVHKDISLLGDSVDDSILDQPCPQIRSPHQEVTLLPSHTSTNCTSSPTRQSPLGQPIGGSSEQVSNTAELTALKHEIQLLRERLDQQSQQTRAAVAHARLLQDQLAAETAARVEAQARTHQLLVQNKELLEHITALVSHLREHERLSGGGVSLSNQPTGGPGQGLAGLPQSTADIGLGQYNPGWESVHGTIYSPLADPYYQPTTYGYAVRPNSNGYVDELRYQVQLWESLRQATGSLYPAPQPPPTATYIPSSPHLLRPGLGLPPSGRPRTSPVPSPRAQQHARAAGFQQHRSRSLDRPPDNSAKEVSFIKPLPHQHQPRTESKGLHDLVRPLRISSPLPAIRTLKEEAVQTEPQPAVPDPPRILLTGPANGYTAGHLEDSGESEREDELAELPPIKPLIRRNSR